MALADSGLEVKVGNNHGPDAEERRKAKKRTTRAVATGTASADDVERRLDGVEDQNDATLDKIPLGKSQVVNEGWDAHGRRNANGLEHALLPEVATPNITSEGKDHNNSENTLNRSIDNTKGESLGVISLPGLDVEGQKS
ncbi:hypothetical protein HG530_002163 [Fusarium avenaceum]|nr:hypothetical protein HG530_002163 [Fusarium avenaceum]